MELVLRGLKFILAVACLIGFVWQILDLLEKWIGAKTTESSTWSSFQTMPFPTLLICDYEGFIETQPFYHEDYRGIARKVEVQVMPLEGTQVIPNHTVKEFPTIYSGICQLVTFIDEYPPFSPIQLALRAKISHVVYFLTPGMEFYYIMHAIIRAQPEVVVEHPTQIEISVQQDIKKDLPCLEGISDEDQAECMRGKVRRNIDIFNTTCFSYPVWYHFPEGKLCNSTEDLQNNFWVAANIHTVPAYAYKEEGCFLPCQRTTYAIHAVPFGDRATKSEDWFTLDLLFTTDLINIKSRVSLTYFSMIIASIGGAMNLFLGLSAFTVLLDFINKMHDAWQKRMTARQASVAVKTPEIQIVKPVMLF
ncbi:uncharacterized protein LOC131890315 [Tigriopus californicus]|uniref:uncharacterized protein LOC131890315 n=1 Tax=Tigriopus californicus TaxID=6832 RepID=UPI0027DA06FC|nr:uncharacterized protein LOC131890315 [Tigriopus californicus]